MKVTSANTPNSATISFGMSKCSFTTSPLGLYKPAVTIDITNTQDEISHASEPVAPPTSPLATVPPERRAGLDQRWVERKKLAVFGEHCLDRSQMGPGIGGESVFAGFVLIDAGHPGHVYLANARQWGR